MNKDHNLYLVKFIIIGNSGVGKSSLAEYYVNRERIIPLHTPTIGVEFYTKTVTCNKKNLKLQIWDTAGQEKFRSVARAYYRDAFGVIICYSITNEKSFLDLEQHFDDLAKFAPSNIIKIIVGACSDLEEKRVISKERAQEFAQRKNALYLETSSVTGKNVDKAFNVVLKGITLQIINKEINPRILGHNRDLPIKPNNGCCG